MSTSSCGTKLSLLKHVVMGSFGHQIQIAVFLGATQLSITVRLYNWSELVGRNLKNENLITSIKNMTAYIIYITALILVLLK